MCIAYINKSLIEPYIETSNEVEINDFYFEWYKQSVAEVLLIIKEQKWDNEQGFKEGLDWYRKSGSVGLSAVVVNKYKKSNLIENHNKAMDFMLEVASFVEDRCDGKTFYVKKIPFQLIF